MSRKCSFRDPVKYLSMFIVALFFVGCADIRGAASNPSALVDLQTLDTSFILDIRYSTKNNFTKTVLYPVAKAKLRRIAAESLVAVQQELRSKGLGLKIFDAYRPLSIQWKLWEVVPDENFVADPRKGSKHNRGAAVDLTIIDSTGKELEMPTGYDDFSEKASHDYTDISAEASKNRALLKDVMTRRGFHPIRSEWWHYDFQGWERFEILDEPF